jgi:hypothetical protein
MKIRMKHPRMGLLLILAACASGSAFADGFDVASYLARVNTYNHSTGAICGLILALAAIDYVWNLLIIGLPSMSICAVGPKKIILDLVTLTILGQVADRLGAVIAFILLGPIPFTLAERIPFTLAERIPFLYVDLGVYDIRLVLSNFVCSGIAIALLVWFFVRKRWGGSTRSALVMAIVAAIATNPMISMFLPLGGRLH